jgi:hypothetical protein
MRIGIAIIFALSTILNAEVKQVQDYHFPEPGDRHRLFSMAVTPNQDVLSFVARDDGKWRLTRLKGWLDKAPVEEVIDVPGWAWRTEDWAHLIAANVDVLVTPDENFVVCVAAAIWTTPGPEPDDFVSLVDLRRFRVLRTMHTSKLPGESQQYYLDRAGRLILRASRQLPGGPGTLPFNGGYEINLKLLRLPDLVVSDQCKYSESGNRAAMRRDGELDCDGFLVRAPNHPASLQEFLDGLQNSFVSDDRISHDGLFRREVFKDSHRNWRGDPVVTKLREDIFARGTGKLAGSVKLTTRIPVDARFAKLNGRNFLLVVEGGIRLKAYEITD